MLLAHRNVTCWEELGITPSTGAAQKDSLQNQQIRRSSS